MKDRGDDLALSHFSSVLELGTRGCGGNGIQP